MKIARWIWALFALLMLLALIKDSVALGAEKEAMGMVERVEAIDAVSQFIREHVPDEHTARQVIQAVQEASDRTGVSRELIAATIYAECGFRPRPSHKGAQGWMQVMPFHFRENEDPNNLHTNIHRGAKILQQCLIKFGDETLAIAAYNAGPGKVIRYGWQVPPYRETRRHVRVVTATREMLDRQMRGGEIE